MPPDLAGHVPGHAFCRRCATESRTVRASARRACSPSSISGTPRVFRPLWLSRMRTCRWERWKFFFSCCSHGYQSLAAALVPARRLQGALGWEYKPFVPITGVNLGAFNANGSVSLPHVLAFARPRPEAVVGAAQSWAFDALASSFQMSYTQVGAAG